MTRFNPSALALTFAAGAMSAYSAPASANSVTYKIGGNPAVFVADNGALDLDPAPDRIKFNINADANVGTAKIRVTATAVAEASPPGTGKPSLTFTTLVITNTAGNVMGGSMWVEHAFTALDGPSQCSSKISGRFDSLTNPGNLGGASLNCLTQVFSPVSGWKTVMNLNTGLFAGAAPVPFVLSGGPVGWKKVTRQRETLNFYLDSPGDSIIVEAPDSSRFLVAALPLLLLPAAAGRRR